MNPKPTCRKCGTKLVKGLNWCKTYEKEYNYICKKCHTKEDLKNQNQGKNHVISLGKALEIIKRPSKGLNSFGLDSLLADRIREGHFRIM